MNRLSTVVSIDLATILLLIILVALVGVFAFCQSKKDNFDLRDILLDPVTGKLSLHSLGQFVALIISSWGFVYVTLHQQLTDWLFFAYMGSWVGATAADKFLGNRSGGSQDHQG